MAMTTSLSIVIVAALLFVACDAAALSDTSRNTRNSTQQLHHRVTASNATCAVTQWYYNTSNGISVVKSTFQCYSNRCNSTFTKPHGTFTSPYYPLMYRPSYCTYTINAPAGKVITISFGKFDVGPEPFNSLCYSDTLIIYDKSVQFSTNTKILCGKNVTSFTSQTNKVILIFQASTKNSYTGFSANYMIKSPASPTHGAVFHTDIVKQNSTCKLIRQHYITPQGQHKTRYIWNCFGVSIGLSLGAIIAIVVSAAVVLIGISITICCCCCACCATCVKKSSKQYSQFT